MTEDGEVDIEKWNSTMVSANYCLFVQTEAILHSLASRVGTSYCRNMRSMSEVRILFHIKRFSIKRKLWPCSLGLSVHKSKLIEPWQSWSIPHCSFYHVSILLHLIIVGNS